MYWLTRKHTTLTTILSLYLVVVRVSIDSLFTFVFFLETDSFLLNCSSSIPYSVPSSPEFVNVRKGICILVAVK